MHDRRHLRQAGLVLLAASLLSPPAMAGGRLAGPVSSVEEGAESPKRPLVLVTKDGQEIELQGPWKEQGSRVIFTDAQGKLQSIRKSEVDFAAMEQRKAQPKVAPRATSAETSTRRAPAVLVLDASNTARYQGDPDPPPSTQDSPSSSGADPTADAAGDGIGEDARGEAPAPAVPGQLSVISWRDLGGEADEEEGETPTIDLRGTVRNDGNRPMRDITIRATFKYADDSVIRTEDAGPRDRVLRPGATSAFRLQLDERFDYATVEFEVLGTPARAGEG